MDKPEAAGLAGAGAGVRARPDEGPLARIRRLLEPDLRLCERVCSTSAEWEGRVFSVELLDVALPDGSHGRRELVRHHGGAGVGAIREDGCICLVRQFRVALGRVSLEIPAGRLEPGEDGPRCAARELGEETGLVAGRLEPVARSLGSPGFTDEATQVFLAYELSAGSSHPDEGELVDVAWVPLDEVLAGIRAGLIDDGKTIVAAQAAALRAHGLA